MGHPRALPDRNWPAERLVPVQPQGQEIPHGHAHQPRHGRRVLEGYRPGQGHLLCRWLRPHRHAQDARLLQGPRPARPQVRLDHARVPPRRRRNNWQKPSQPSRRERPLLLRRLIPDGRRGGGPVVGAGGRVGHLQVVQEEEHRRAAPSWPERRQWCRGVQQPGRRRCHGAQPEQLLVDGGHRQRPRQGYPDTAALLRQRRRRA
ncbi:hypothetical protein VPH35_134650 [Triticum aestivum]